MPATIWTIGHSTRPIEEFLGLLAGARIGVIADVRSFPGSSKCPQYGKEALAATLATHTISHHSLQALGGRRRVLPDSSDTAWRNASFRGYADYMSSTEFEHRLTQLLKVASKAHTATMCAEAVWWRCHRSMIADALRLRGIEVMHILDANHNVAHPMTAPARIVQGELTYAKRESG